MTPEVKPNTEMIPVSLNLSLQGLINQVNFKCPRNLTVIWSPTVLNSFTSNILYLKAMLLEVNK